MQNLQFFTHTTSASVSAWSNRVKDPFKAQDFPHYTNGIFGLLVQSTGTGYDYLYLS